jgi:hypothetical protein
VPAAEGGWADSAWFTGSTPHNSEGHITHPVLTIVVLTPSARDTDAGSRLPESDVRVSPGNLGSRACSFPACLGSTTPQCLRRTSVVTHVTVLPSGSPDTVGASDFGCFGAHQLQGYPAYMCPCPTSGVAHRPHMVRARMVRYSFSCMTLSFTTSRRFIPTVSRRERLPHLSITKANPAALKAQVDGMDLEAKSET